jgi:hypothetical protein
MAKFKLTGLITVSVYTTVEADTLEEAISIAKERDIESYNYGTLNQDYDVWVNDGYDGVVKSITQD